MPSSSYIITIIIPYDLFITGFLPYFGEFLSAKTSWKSMKLTDKVSWLYHVKIKTGEPGNGWKIQGEKRSKEWPTKKYLCGLIKWHGKIKAFEFTGKWSYKIEKHDHQCHSTWHLMNKWSNFQANHWCYLTKQSLVAFCVFHILHPYVPLRHGKDYLYLLPYILHSEIWCLWLNSKSGCRTNYAWSLNSSELT